MPWRLKLYGISPEEVGAEKAEGRGQKAEGEKPKSSDDDGRRRLPLGRGPDLPSLVHGLIEYALGVAFLVASTCASPLANESPSPRTGTFRLPSAACSPGMLVVRKAVREPEVREPMGKGEGGELPEPTTATIPPSTNPPPPPHQRS